MIDLHLRVEDTQYPFFIELIEKFNFVELNETKQLSENQIKILEKRKHELLSGEVKGMDYSEIERMFV